MRCDGRVAEEVLWVCRCSILRRGLPEDGLEGAQGAVRRDQGGIHPSVRGSNEAIGDVRVPMCTGYYWNVFSALAWPPLDALLR